MSIRHWRDFMYSIKCHKCGRDIFLDDINLSGKTIKYSCECGVTGFITTKKPVKETAKKFIAGFAKTSMKVLETAVSNYNQNCEIAEKGLHRRDYEDWDLEKLKYEFENSTDAFEKKLIGERIKELMQNEGYDNNE